MVYLTPLQFLQRVSKSRGKAWVFGLTLWYFRNVPKGRTDHWTGSESQLGSSISWAGAARAWD